MRYSLQAARSLTVTLVITGMMLILDSVAIVAQFAFGLLESHPLVRLLNMEYERNIPTIWSTLLLIYAAILLVDLAMITFRQSDKYRWHWMFLALAFFYLSLDEAFELHEKSMRLTSSLFASNHVKLSGLLYYSWVIPAGLALVVMGILYVRFVLRFPARTRNLFILSCLIYAGSAIGFELLEGPMDQAGNWMDLPYAILVTLEETFEMVGICLFTYAVIDYRNSRYPNRRFGDYCKAHAAPSLAKHLPP